MSRWARIAPLLLIASLIACEPESPQDHPESPESDESVIMRSSPPSSHPSIPGINPGKSHQQPGIDYNDGDELYEGDDMFYICETLGEESDRCDEWMQAYG